MGSVRHTADFRAYYRRIAEEFETVADLVRHRPEADCHFAEHLEEIAVNIRRDTGLPGTGKNRALN